MTVKASNRVKKRNVAPDSERKDGHLSCKTRGHAFATFFEEMAEHDAKQLADLEPKGTNKRRAEIRYSKCGSTHDYS